MKAAERGRTEIVKLLLEKKADPNLRNILGETALDIAWNTEIIEIIKQYGGKPGKELE